MATGRRWNAGMLERRVIRDSARVGLLVFAAAAAVGFVAAIVPTPLAHPQLTMAGAIVAGVAIAVAVPVVRWPKLPLLATLVILYFAALALLVFGDNGHSEGLLALVAIPVVASALYGPRTLTVIAVVAATAVLVCYGSVSALTTADEAQLLAVWPITGIGIAYAIHGFRYRLERTIADRERAIQRDAVLALIADELYSTFDGDQVIQLGLQSAARLTDLDGGPQSQAAFFLIEGDRATLIASYAPDSSADGRPDPRIDQLSVPLASTSRLLEAVGGENHRLFTLDRTTPIPPEVGPALAELGVENAIVQLIRVGDRATGILAVFNNQTESHGYTVGQQEWLRSLAPLLELAISRGLVFDERTTTDALTGLANRREFDRRLAALPRSNVYSILAIDIDKLKTMNDTFGHGAGDELLRVVSAALHRSIRRGDTAARVGGDEFCVILPDSEGRRAEVVARRILSDLGSRSVQGRHPSVSIGIAGFTSGHDAETRLAAADAALYAAKRAGGNRAEHAVDGVVQRAVRPPERENRSSSTRPARPLPDRAESVTPALTTAASGPPAGG